MAVRGGRIPLPLKAGYSVFVLVLVLAYLPVYGLQNFLWLSDVAVFVTLVGLWLESALLISMAAVGVLWFALGWTANFFVGGVFVDGMDYMFDSGIPVFVRALSLFHVVLPPMLLWVLGRLGYDPRALPWQTVLVWAVLVSSYALTDPALNINWVFGPGAAEPPLPGPLWLLFLMAAVPVVVCYSAHIVLQAWFGARGRAAAEEESVPARAVED